MGVLQLLQSRPALEQIGDQGAVQVVEPVQNLREVQLQGSGETIAMAGFLVYQLAAFFSQEMQQVSGCKGRRDSRWRTNKSSSEAASWGSLLAPDGENVSR
jgi:hypothetical protein